MATVIQEETILLALTPKEAAVLKALMGARYKSSPGRESSNIYDALHRAGVETDREIYKAEDAVQRPAHFARIA